MTSPDMGMGTDVVVLSPHVDDGVFSLGAWIARATRAGTRVRVVTVLAGDPSSARPAGPWDRKGGFRTAGEAARARREEERRACALLGATPVWLHYGDEQYGRGAGDEEIWSDVVASVEGADTILAPGCPLEHEDHAWLTRLVLERPIPGARIGFYLEQPHAMWRWARMPWTPPVIESSTGRRLAWRHLISGREAVRHKRAAYRAYRSQFRAARPLLSWRFLLYEGWSGREFAAWMDPSARSGA